MSAKIRKVVFPVAGMGTRFLPATKASPKEMLPIVDKPLIQYAAEEAVAAGMTELIFVTGRSKRAIEDHFDTAFELEAELAAKEKTDMLELVRGVLPRNVNCIYIRQSAPLGLGHAVSCARSVVGDDPFAVMLADDLITSSSAGCLKQMVEAFEHYRCSILAIEQIALEDTDKYGIVDQTPMTERVGKVNGIVEKPKPEDAPSCLGVVGRYILTPRILELLESIPKGAGGEIQLTDAIAALLNTEAIYAYQFEGKRFDCGNIFGYLEATLGLAMQRDDLRDRLKVLVADIARQL